MNSGQPQLYGSQIRCTSGVPAPATALVDPARADERRAQVGMVPLAQYYKEFTLMCSDEAAEGITSGGG